MNADPVHDEFFNTEALDSLSAALVRESNQNTLDARDGQVVRVRIVFGQGDWEISPLEAAQYLSGIWPHFETVAPELRADGLPVQGQSLTYLAIEDFGTRGLRGDPSQWRVDGGTNGQRNDFFYFWRNLGRSKKGDTDRGRWGLGHTVFAASSQINSFFGVTVRSDDNRALLMGQSILRIHGIGEDQYEPYGHFGMVEDDSFVMPVDSESQVAKFCQDFHLDRLRGPGLSVVIPYPDPSIDRVSIAKAALTDYFYPILNGTLEVELVTPNGSMILDRQGLRSSAQQLFASEPSELNNLNRVFDLVEWSARLSPDDWSTASDLFLALPAF